MKETKDNTNEKIHCTCELEELIWLKWPYYSRQSTDSTLPLSKYQNCHKTRTNDSKVECKHKDKIHHLNCKKEASCLGVS